MARLAVTVVVALALLAPAASAASGFTLERVGGNIRPFTIAIGANGDVTATGIAVGRTRLGATALTRLTRAARTDLAGLPSLTSCPGTLPDIASLRIRALGRTVAVHGACRPRFAALVQAILHETVARI